MFFALTSVEERAFNEGMDVYHKGAEEYKEEETSCLLVMAGRGIAQSRRKTNRQSLNMQGRWGVKAGDVSREIGAEVGQNTEDFPNLASRVRRNSCEGAYWRRSLPNLV